MGASVWNALSVFVAFAALVFSIVVFVMQRRRDRQQDALRHQQAEFENRQAELHAELAERQASVQQERLGIEKRLARLEEERAGHEAEVRRKVREAALVAKLDVVEFRMEQPQPAGHSDLVSVTVANQGPAPATSVDIAILMSEDSASRLGEKVEATDELGGWGGRSPKSYFQVPWQIDAPRPFETLGPGQRVTFPFWIRTPPKSARFRIVWHDGRGAQIARQLVEFDRTPAYR